MKSFELESARKGGHGFRVARRLTAMRAKALATAFAFLALSPPIDIASARAAVLITERESKLPDADKRARGPMLGPKVLVVSPARDASGVKSPFALVIRFEERDGVQVDLNSLVVTYEKSPPVDLTERVKEFLTPGGIAMPQAETPPGNHRLHVEIKDVEGRLGGTEFSIDAAP
jgi:hypothetical protein